MKLFTFFDSVVARITWLCTWNISANVFKASKVSGSMCSTGRCEFCECCAAHVTDFPLDIHTNTHTLHEDWLTPLTVKFAVAVTYWHSENETTDIRLVHLQSNQSSLAKNNRRQTRLAIITTKITQVLFHFRAWNRKSIEESLHSDSD